MTSVCQYGQKCVEFTWCQPVDNLPPIDIDLKWKLLLECVDILTVRRWAVVWDAPGVMHSEFIYTATSIYYERYRQTLEKLEARLWRVRPHTEQPLQHDMATLNTRATTAEIRRFGFTVMDHPPTIQPSGFNLFPYRKDLRGYHNASDDQLWWLCCGSVIKMHKCNARAYKLTVSQSVQIARRLHAEITNWLKQVTSSLTLRLLMSYIYIYIYIYIWSTHSWCF